MYRLAALPVIAAALAGGEVSVSWGRRIGDWTDPLPAEVRDDADAELLSAVGHGASLHDLAQIAEELRRVHARPDDDEGDGFADRKARLGRTFGAAGRLVGALKFRRTVEPESTLDSRASGRGPEGDPTLPQCRHHSMAQADT